MGQWSGQNQRYRDLLDFGSAEILITLYVPVTNKDTSNPIMTSSANGNHQTIG